MNKFYRVWVLAKDNQNIRSETPRHFEYAGVLKIEIIDGFLRIEHDNGEEAFFAVGEWLNAIKQVDPDWDATNTEN